MKLLKKENIESMKSMKNIVSEAQLNFDNILEMNEQFPFVQKKDQTKKNMGNAYDFDRKQVIGSEYDNKELENA